MSNLIFIPCASLKANSICNYNRVENLEILRRKPKSNIHEKKALSKKQAKRVRECIEYLFWATKNKTVFSKESGKYFKFKLNFLTLTLPSCQIHSDSEILEYILKPFLRICRKKYIGFLYLWKAEVQDNGNIHFHLNTNQYIDYRWLRSTWNTCCEKLNYVSNSKSENPNSTDVKAVKNSKELASYMSKYISKGDLYKKPLLRYFKKYKKEISAAEISYTLPKKYFENLKRKIDIKLWGCSEVLLNAKENIEGVDSMVYREMQIASTDAHIVQLDYANIAFGVNYRTGKTPILENIMDKLKERISIEEKEMVSKIYI